MQKEVVVSIIVILLIIFLNMYINIKLEKQLSKINYKIIEIQEGYLEKKEEGRIKELKKKMIELENLVNDTNNMLLIYIGHEELDEISKLIKTGKVNLKYNDYISIDYKLEKCKIIMQDLIDKNKISWINIF